MPYHWIKKIRSDYSREIETRIRKCYDLGDKNQNFLYTQSGADLGFSQRGMREGLFLEGFDQKFEFFRRALSLKIKLFWHPLPPPPPKKKLRPCTLLYF